MDTQRRRTLGTLFFALVLLLALPVGKMLLFAFSAPQPGSAQATIIEVRKGESPNELAKVLTSAGAVHDGRKFVLLGRLTRQWRRIKAGEYKVSPAMSPLEIFATITSGISVPHPITVREGENMYEVADDVAAKGLATREKFISLCKDPAFIASTGLGPTPANPEPPKTLEGYLFPDTYFFNRTMSPEEILRQMVRHFLSVWGKDEAARAKALGFTRHQIVTLASIIEKETGAPEERPLISSVFHNRLRKKMRLQSDPTTIYGMWSRYTGKIHKRDLSVKNDYNTYVIPALPIGPISNPGKEAIRAALNPAQSDYLYFVSHNDGTHQFSRTFAEHNAAVRKFQLDPKAREGKSWRDRLKQPHQRGS